MKLLDCASRDCAPRSLPPIHGLCLLDGLRLLDGLLLRLRQSPRGLHGGLLSRLLNGLLRLQHDDRLRGLRLLHNRLLLLNGLLLLRLHAGLGQLRRLRLLGRLGRLSGLRRLSRLSGLCRLLLSTCSKSLVDRIALWERKVSQTKEEVRWISAFPRLCMSEVPRSLLIVHRCLTVFVDIIAVLWRMGSTDKREKMLAKPQRTARSGLTRVCKSRFLASATDISTLEWARRWAQLITGDTQIPAQKDNTTGQ